VDRSLSGLKASAELRCVEADLLDADLGERIGTEPIDLIVHGAERSGEQASVLDPLGFHRANVTATLRMLELARERKVPHFVLASSSSVYGEHPARPWKEDARDLLPAGPYGVTKLAAEGFARVHSDLHGLRVTVLRYGTLYGSGVTTESAVDRMVEGMMAGASVQRFGTADDLQAFTVIDDAVALTRVAMDRAQGAAFEIYNVGHPTAMTLAEVIRTVEEELGVKAQVVFLPLRPGEVGRSAMDMTKTARDLGLVPNTSFRDGARALLMRYRKV
jgi:UDP-glucuronate 4-epimerase